MDTNHPSKPFFERSLINWLLVICVVLGFICVAAIYLPTKLEGGQFSFFKHPSSGPSRLLALLPAEEKTQEKHLPPMQSRNGIYFRFVPEGAPPLPYADNEPDNYNREGDLLAQASHKDKTGESNKTATQALSLSTSHTHETSSIALYNPSGASERDRKLSGIFKVPPKLEADVNFWKDVFTKHDSHQTILHDPEHLDIVYGVLNFRYLDANPVITAAERERRRQDKIDAQKDKILAILEVLEKNPHSDKLTDKEYEIKRLFKNVKDPEKFSEAIKRGVRAQTGQKDKFLLGLKYSGRYLGEIEKIFEQEGLPRELTRLIFVESMFNPRAHSSAGASGIWQFMRRTGKHYALKINSILDERLDPLRSTYAATRILKHNYQELGTWPLAINAYNAGRGRLKQAVRRMGTRDIATIVRHFDHPSYGFASRNFYMEFLAAMEVVQNHHKYFRNIKFDEPLSYDVVWLNEPINVPEVSRMSGISVGDLAELNPGYRDAVFSGEIPFPARSELRVPKDKGKAFTSAAGRVPSVFPFWYTVGADDNIYDIASMYNVSVSDILRANKHLDRRLKSGQRLRITR